MGEVRAPRFLAAVCVAIALTFAPGTASAGKGPRAHDPLEPSTAYAAFVMSKIATAVRLDAPPDIYRAPVAAAHAVFVRGREAVVYNPGFLDEINDRAGTPWAAVSVIAHELGHHYYGHSHEKIDGLPPDVLHERELEADYFSGFVLARMGASLEDAEAAQEALFADADSPTHPDSYRRLVAISAGWRDGERDATPAANPAARLAGEMESAFVRGFAPEAGAERGGGGAFPSGLW
jgi:hypothetical protein